MHRETGRGQASAEPPPRPSIKKRRSGVGGYDRGYAACPCYWGAEPSSLVRDFLRTRETFDTLRVLDAGCGEGKNAAAFARLGSTVEAIDVSAKAVANGRAAWPSLANIHWREGDVSDPRIGLGEYDVVIAYGLVHCLRSPRKVRDVIRRLQAHTIPGGYHILCAFNDRYQDLTAHPGFAPTLIAHSEYVAAYTSWTLLLATDSDLHDVHPDNGLAHDHSLTRILARRPR
jgi:2-polyprenyl-3-methyl-5-hydroxy-6-metoxy-1,4-benzoquinol methylase